MKQVSFDVTKKDAAIIRKIAKRAAGFDSTYTKTDCAMDITAVHANKCPLRLAELLKAGDFNFIHDVAGIRHKLNRNTGELTGGFWPRYAVPEVAHG